MALHSIIDSGRSYKSLGSYPETIRSVSQPFRSFENALRGMNCFKHESFQAVEDTKIPFLPFLPHEKLARALTTSAMEDNVTRGEPIERDIWFIVAITISQQFPSCRQMSFQRRNLHDRFPRCGINIHFSGLPRAAAVSAAHSTMLSRTPNNIPRLFASSPKSRNYRLIDLSRASGNSI